MKTAVKSVLGGIWRAGAPVRRPFTRAYARFLANQQIRLFAHLEGQEQRIHEQIQQLSVIQHQMHRDLATDLELSLDSIVRELARLQMQVEVLQRTVEQEIEHRESSVHATVFRKGGDPRMRENEHLPNGMMRVPLG